MEPEKDFVLIRDGENANAPILATLTGSEVKRSFISSTGNKVCLHFLNVSCLFTFLLLFPAVYLYQN